MSQFRVLLVFSFPLPTNFVFLLPSLVLLFMTYISDNISRRGWSLLGWSIELSTSLTFLCCICLKKWTILSKLSSPKDTSSVITLNRIRLQDIRLQHFSLSSYILALLKLLDNHHVNVECCTCIFVCLAALLSFDKTKR